MCILSYASSSYNLWSLAHTGLPEFGDIGNKIEFNAFIAAVKSHSADEKDQQQQVRGGGCEIDHLK